MSKNRTRPERTAHPSWCNRAYDGRDHDHDPHTSRHERVHEELPSDLVINAYLLQARSPAPVHPDLATAAIEFACPGEQTASFLMTFGQLRRLSEALSRLVSTGEINIFPPTSG